jgi:hypothetical protein
MLSGGHAYLMQRMHFPQIYADFNTADFRRSYTGMLKIPRQSACIQICAICGNPSDANVDHAAGHIAKVPSTN